MRKAQGAFEYILMLAGILLVVILIVLILNGTVKTANNGITTNANTYSNLTNVSSLLH
jgi:hypothetical protein